MHAASIYNLQSETGDPPEGWESEGQTGNPPVGWESEGQIINRTETGPKDSVFDVKQEKPACRQTLLGKQNFNDANPHW